jgi:plasmid stabilization system protein ParE
VGPAWSRGRSGATLRVSRSSSRSLHGRGRRVPELEPTELRELLPGTYRLIYRVEPTEVSIVAQIHGARSRGAVGGSSDNAEEAGFLPLSLD